MMRHVPVLLKEVLDSLQLNPGDNVIDCTVGDAGHAEKILEQTAPNGKLLAIDADPESILRAKQYLHEFGPLVIYARDNFAHLKNIVRQDNFGPVNGILMDLGWSSPQFAERGRGFSFQNLDEPLDMRYAIGDSRDAPLGRLTAANVLNTESEQALEKIFREYGEEHLSKEIAAAIVAKRKEQPIERTNQLVDIILATYRTKLSRPGRDPAHRRRCGTPPDGGGRRWKITTRIPWIGGLHPATKVFQALRIAVNDELGVIERALPQAVETLAPGGRLAVITFHSLEDRLVKHWFQKHDSKTIRLVNKKPIGPTRSEVESNPRSASAKLRVIEKIV